MGEPGLRAARRPRRGARPDDLPTAAIETLVDRTGVGRGIVPVMSREEGA